MEVCFVQYYHKCFMRWTKSLSPPGCVYERVRPLATPPQKKKNRYPRIKKEPMSEVMKKLKYISNLSNICSQRSNMNTLSTV